LSSQRSNTVCRKRKLIQNVGSKRSKKTISSLFRTHRGQLPRCKILGMVVPDCWRDHANLEETIGGTTRTSKRQLNIAQYGIGCGTQSLVSPARKIRRVVPTCVQAPTHPSSRLPRLPHQRQGSSHVSSSAYDMHVSSSSPATRKPLKHQPPVSVLIVTRKHITRDSRAPPTWRGCSGLHRVYGLGFEV